MTSELLNDLVWMKNRNKKRIETDFSLSLGLLIGKYFLRFIIWSAVVLEDGRLEDFHDHTIHQSMQTDPVSRYFLAGIQNEVIAFASVDYERIN